jgi:hypothetical protein
MELYTYKLILPISEKISKLATNQKIEYLLFGIKSDNEDYNEIEEKITTKEIAFSISKNINLLIELINIEIRGNYNRLLYHLNCMDKEKIYYEFLELTNKTDNIIIKSALDNDINLEIPKNLFNEIILFWKFSFLEFMGYYRFYLSKLNKLYILFSFLIDYFPMNSKNQKDINNVINYGIYKCSKYTNNSFGDYVADLCCLNEVINREQFRKMDIENKKMIHSRLISRLSSIIITKKIDDETRKLINNNSDINLFDEILAKIII